MTPLVAVSAYLEPASWGVWCDVPAVLVPAAYVRHLQAAGASVVLVPPGEEGTELLTRVDALVLAGGVDVASSRYGADPHARAQSLRPDRDDTELRLARVSAALDLPTLGICRGMQVMAVAAGGTLEQHLPDRLGHDGHSPAPGCYGTHRVRTAAGSRVADVLGPEVDVASYHHQGVASWPGHTATAWSDDGVVEALEAPDARFRVGVQWHPEVGADPHLFQALVAAAGEHGQG